ncbi:MAG: methyltransferase domain-containing protein, partial [Candidatus Dormibacteraeota bacterium]|nr:methyltransferase domain-containing protein [Candidatus Dormibacteraeota bacterium]
MKPNWSWLENDAGSAGHRAGHLLTDNLEVDQPDATSISRAFVDQSVPVAYDRFMRPQLFEPWAEVLLAAAGVSVGQRVLDVASGTGVVAHAAARTVGRGGTVTAADISAAMLDVNRSRDAEPGSAAIEFVECSATAMPFEDRSFDVVLCQQALHFIPDRAAAIAEMHRVLRPGCVAAASVWARGRDHGLFMPVIETLAAAGIGEPFPRAYDMSMHSLSAARLADAFMAAGFSDVRVDTDSVTSVWPDSATAAAAVHGMPFGPS